jgi:hypothetical protein
MGRGRGGSRNGIEDEEYEMVLKAYLYGRPRPEDRTDKAVGDAALRGRIKVVVTRREGGREVDNVAGVEYAALLCYTTGGSGGGSCRLPDAM